jgi:hypothetical protein
VGIEVPATIGADPAQMADEEGVAEQVGPDFQSVEPCFAAVRPDADQGGRPGNSGSCNGSTIDGFRACGRDAPRSVSFDADSHLRHWIVTPQKETGFPAVAGSGRGVSATVLAERVSSATSYPGSRRRAS